MANEGGCMKIAMLQVNPLVGDMQENAKCILEKIYEAHAQGAKIIMTPELALCGFPPADLLLRPAFMQACDEAVAWLVQQTAKLEDLYLLLGHPVALQQLSLQDRLKRYNAVSVIHGGRILHIYAKHILADAQTAVNSRYFVSGKETVVFEVQGIKFGVLIGGDVFDAPHGEHPARKALEAGAQVLLHSSATPFYATIQEELQEQVGKVARLLQTPILTTLMAGGQDELVLCGGSFGVDRLGEVICRAKQLDEEVFYTNIELSASKSIQEAQTTPTSYVVLSGVLKPLYDIHEALWRALVLGLKDYMRKNGFLRVILGLSGGMDSALVLALAVDAIGAENVHAVMMPSTYTSTISCEDAQKMAKRMGVRYDVIPISQPFDTFKQMLAPVFSELPAPKFEDTTEENLQARVRGCLLMAISNRTGALVLATGNKSELAVGYCTLYGDLVGGFAPIKDVCKTHVYELAHWRNQHNPYQTVNQPIPERIITRPPSAELRPNQTDQDNLPDYAVLDAIIMYYVEANMSVEEIVKLGFTSEDVEKVVRLIKISEYKRRQGPIGTKVTSRAFGGDWRYPITSKFKA